MPQRDHPKWGPKFDRYMDVHDDRLGKAYSDYVSSRETTSVPHDDLIPLSLLETMLSVGDNMHKSQYQHGSKSLPVIMTMMRKYVELNQNGIFEDYYGFLLIRHLERTICIGVLLQVEFLDPFLKSLNPNMQPVEVSSALADVALDNLRSALEQNDPSCVRLCLDIKPSSQHAFECVGGLSFDDAEFLIMAIWKNRRRLISIIQHGMLPGFFVMLFTLCQLTVFSSTRQAQKKWTQLQDIVLRSYIVGALDEKILIRNLAITIDSQIQAHDLIGVSGSDEEDARQVVRSYVNMYRPIFAGKKKLAGVILLDIANIVFRFVNSFLIDKLEDCIPDAAGAALERVWMEFDRESDGLMAAPRRGFTRKYAADVFFFLSDLRRRMNSKDVTRAYVSMLMQTRATELVGRVLMMITRETSNPNDWDYLRKDLPSMSDAMFGMFRHDPDARVLEHCDWVKVLNQLNLIATKTVHSNAPNSYITQAIESWYLFGEDRNMDWGPCANPRCAFGKVDLRVVKSSLGNYICGKCLKPVYCSKRCQLVHWNLPNSQSHAANCVPAS